MAKDAYEMLDKIVSVVDEEIGTPQQKEYGPEWPLGEDKWIGDTRYLCVDAKGECGACAFYYYNRYKKGQECKCDISVFGPCNEELREDKESVCWQVIGGVAPNWGGSKLDQGGGIE